LISSCKALIPFKDLGKERDSLVETQAKLEEALAVEKDNVANLNMSLDELRSTMANQKDSCNSQLRDNQLTIDDLKDRLAALGQSYEGLKRRCEKEKAEYAKALERFMSIWRKESEEGLDEKEHSLHVNLKRVRDAYYHEEDGDMDDGA